MLLSDPLHARALLIPFLRDEATTMIRGAFIQAGGFRSHQPAQRREHLREARHQEPQQFFWKMGIWHGAEMLSMSLDQSNPARIKAASDGARGLSFRLLFGQETAAIEQERVSRRAGVRI